MFIAVGSKNPSKLLSVAMALQRYYPNDSIKVSVHSMATIQDTHGNNINVLGQLVKVIQDHNTINDDTSENKKQHHIIGVEVSSCVADQPMSSNECLIGARHRSKSIRDLFNTTYTYIQSCNTQSIPIDYTTIIPTLDSYQPDYTVGLEGGLYTVQDVWMEAGFIVVHDINGKEGVGTSPSFMIARHVLEKLQSGKELCEVVDMISGESDVRSTLGMMGMITNGVLGRAEAYHTGVLFAMAPFMSPPQWWD